MIIIVRFSGRGVKIDYFREVQWSTGEDDQGMGDEIEAAYAEFLHTNGQ